MKTPEIKYEHILYTTEFSQNWKDVFYHAFNIANQYKARLTFLHVLNTELIDLLTFDVGLERLPSVEKKFSEAKDFTTNVQKDIVNKIIEEFGDEVLDQNNILVERGNPVKTILKVAEENKCDLIVMGFKGRSGNEDSTIGDTVNRVLHKSKLPVLVVHNIND
ncbi:MAG: universal stress protein UspA [Melioribacteraceae bacterium]|nr:MAG: universal stress protein UspA [Melioribacteraceae bacterium]